MSVEIKLVWEDWADQTLPLPTYVTPGAAGADVRANLPEAERFFGMRLEPFQRRVVPTGLKIEVPPGYEVQVRPRSGLALKRGIAVANAPGTVDSDYRGQLGILLINLDPNETYTVTHGDRIAQLVVSPVLRATFKVEGGLSDSERGEGGFGSTGKS